ncbi:MAG TPA: tetratricopeptide repeat protein [Candidatus Acidoferrum sp.]|jgi:tetratricopeptide (TPR) repeat protein
MKTLSAVVRKSRRTSLCLSFALACGSLAFCQTSPNSSKPISDALQARNYDQAIALSQSALQQTPNNPQLWTLQGIAYASKGDSKLALAAFQHALKISPNNIAALAGAAQIEYQLGSQDGVPLLNHLLQLRPGDPTASAMLAVLEYRQGNCKAAAPNFERAAELVDSQIDALHAYATCLVRLKRFDDAVTVFQKAVALRPGDPQEVRVLASIQLLGHKPQDAISTLRPLLDSKEADSGTLQLASRAYEDAGDTPQAVATLRQAILLDPKNTSLYLDFANVAFAHQSFQVGIDVISEGITLQQKADELYVARGVLFVQLAQYEKAEADFEKAYELNPNQSMSTAAQGLAAVQANDFGRALKSVQEKLAHKPNDPLLLYLQADILTQMGGDAGTPEFRLAMRSAKRAVALQPTLAAAHTVLAKLYMQTGHYQEAAEECRRALAIDPKDQAAVYRLIQALRKTGQNKDIPELLSRLAQLREQATNDERERYRYKLLEDGKPESQ